MKSYRDPVPEALCYPMTLENEFPVAWENVVYEPKHDEAWYRVTIREGDGSVRNVGSPVRKRRIGVMFIDCFVPVGSGRGKAEYMAKKVMSRYYEGLLLDGNGLGVDVTNVDQQPGGGVAVDEFYSIQVRVSWECDVWARWAIAEIGDSVLHNEDVIVHEGEEVVHVK